MQISEVVLFSSLLPLYLFSWRGFLHHTMTVFWHWCWIQMQTSPDAAVKPLGFWVIVLGTALLQSVPCVISASQLNPGWFWRWWSVYFVFQWPDTAHLCVSLSFLQFYFLCCCATKRQKDWNRLTADGTHMACIYTGQVTEHSVSPDAAKATPKFSPSRHCSLVCVKKINIFLLASILLLCICLAGFKQCKISTFIPLAYLYKFQKDFCSHLLPLCLYLSWCLLLSPVQYKIGAMNIVKCWRAVLAWVWTIPTDVEKGEVKLDKEL